MSLSIHYTISQSVYDHVEIHVYIHVEKFLKGKRLLIHEITLKQEAH